MPQEEQQAGSGNQPELIAQGVEGIYAGDIVIIGGFDPSSDEEYLAHVLTLIQKYDKKAFRRKLVHNGLQLTIFVGAAAATILVAFSQIISGILTGIVTVATAVANYYKFGEHSRNLESVAEDMALEYNRFKTKRGIYKDKAPEEALPLFMDRVESFFLEQKQRADALEQLKEAQK